MFATEVLFPVGIVSIFNCPDILDPLTTGENGYLFDIKKVPAGNYLKTSDRSLISLLGKDLTK